MTLRASLRSQFIHLLTIHTTKKRFDHARRLALRSPAEYSASRFAHDPRVCPSNLTPGLCPRASAPLQEPAQQAGGLGRAKSPILYSTRGPMVTLIASSVTS
jgi:hypothetical protein